MLESCQQKNPASGCPLDTPSLPFSSGRYSALSLLPAKGATAVLSAQGNMYRSFQSTHPRGVRLKLSTNPVTARTVSIHAPARGATFTQGAGLSNKNLFQSTHPRGVRRIFPVLIFHISRFQSTHPRGVRHTRFLKPTFQNLFQSTHPRGVRLVTS